MVLGEIMKVGYVVLYVTDEDACLKFWTEKVGMRLQEKTETPAGKIYRVGFENQQFSFELVPLALMKDNPHNLNLGTPSICFYVDNIDAQRAQLVEKGIQATEVSQRNGIGNFAFSDNENRWFAVLEKS